MKKMGFLLLLVLALLLGFTAAFLKRSSPPPVIATPSGGGNVMSGDSRQGKTIPATRPEAGPVSEELPDLHGLSVGTGEVLVEVPPQGVNCQSMGEDFSASSEEECLVWPKTSGKFKEIEDQVKDIKAQIDEVTLDTVSKTLNSLPFVSAEPEEAEWHVSEGEVRLEITIPADDMKIGPNDH